MDPIPFSPSAFIDPTGKNLSQVEALFQSVAKILLTHLSSACDRSPLPGAIDLSALAILPEMAIPESVLLEQLQLLLSASMNAAHPGYLGHMDSMPTTMSVLGDGVAAALNNNMLSVEMSPVFSRLEPLLLQQFAARFGLGPESGGQLLSGGSLANLQALAVARNQKFQCQQTGVVGLEKQPVLFASEMAHTSLQKAAMLLGLGTAAVIPVPTNAHAQMSALALNRLIEKATSAGQAPFCVVATAGTTITGNVDPLAEIHQVAHAHQLWFHVDASYGGALLFSPQYRHKLAGIERADSITFNPQKWLYVAKTSVMLLFRNMQQLRSQFQIAAPYMHNAEDWVNLGELSVQGTRHVDVLKLWLSLQHLGQQGYARLIQHSYQLTDVLVQEIKSRPYLELASQPELNIICFRGVPPEIPASQWNQWNTDLQAYLLQTGNLFVSLPLYRGERWLKAVLLNPYTEPSHLLNLIQAIDQFRLKIQHL
jgi:glutamate/tyrosine decarboxylase-like PLP-dependent enzyme